jgi:hypothetical protein
MRLSAQTAWIVGIFLVTEMPVTFGVISEVIFWWFNVKLLTDDVNKTHGKNLITIIRRTTYEP